MKNISRNIFDVLIVSLYIVVTWILSVVGSLQTLRMLTTLRIIRLLRLGKLMRIMRSFKELWLIVNGLLDSLKTLGWVSLLLVLLLYVCAIFTTIQGWSVSLEKWEVE